MANEKNRMDMGKNSKETNVKVVNETKNKANNKTTDAKNKTNNCK